jgi:hypothetical protein
MRFNFDIDPVLPTSIDDLAKQLNKWRQRIQDVGRTLQRNPFMDGVLIEDVALAAAPNNSVDHKLGRAPRGWFVTKAETAPANLREVSSTTRTIVLDSTDACTVSIWFF